jgi:hypothetical protein
MYLEEKLFMAAHATFISSGLIRSVPLALLYKQNRSIKPITPLNLSEFITESKNFSISRAKS